MRWLFAIFLMFSTSVFDATILPSSPASLVTTEPFNPGWETLPPNYYGHDPEAIYKAVDALVDESKWKKDEFEKLSKKLLTKD